MKENKSVTKIVLCDLTHDAQTISSEFMPYALGCIASYSTAHIEYPLKFYIYKFLNEFKKKIIKDIPHIIGFSHYMWNADLTLKVASIIKKEYKDITIIFGGPNFPVEIERQKEWLIQNTQVDFFIPFEGEKPFCVLLSALIEENFCIDKVRKRKIPGTCSYDKNDFFIYPTEDRIKNIDEIPSPYLQGYLDKYFDTSLWPIVETKRGCPFQCAFCSEGSKYFNYVSKKSLSSIEEELLYLARKSNKNSMVFFADSNFLMYKDDLETCKMLQHTQEKYNWPTFIGCSTGKNRKDLILKGAKLLNGKITIAASVQSLDERVLKNVNRVNISQSQLISMVSEVQEKKGIAYSELIVCLPGDTVETHFASMEKLVASGIAIIKHHVLLLIEGSSLASPQSRKKFGFKTKWRVVTKSFGNYFLMGEKLDSVEFEEVVVETNSLSFEGYLACRKIGLVVHYFYNDSLFEEMHVILRYFNISIWDWLIVIYKSIDKYKNAITPLYNSYLGDVKNELWSSKDEVRQYVERHMDEFISGMRGSNLTFKYRGLLHRDYVRDAYDFAFIQLKKVLSRRYDVKKYERFFEQLKQFCILRKENIFNSTKDVKKIFNFDFTRIYDGQFSKELFQEIKHPIEIRIVHSKKQKEFIEKYFATHSRADIVDIASLLNRVPAKIMYREAKIKKRRLCSNREF